ncbi:MAG: carboxylesterase family protein, partial [Planctomycetota bacterium]
FLLLSLLPSALLPGAALAGQKGPEGEVPARWLVIGPLPPSRRAAFVPDVVAARYVLALPPKGPEAGEAVPGILDPWTVWKPDAKGWIKARPLRNGYAYAAVEAEEDGALLAEGLGHYYFYVNGEPFPGDVYKKRRGPVAIPVRKGVNHLYVRVVRGQFTLRLREPESPLLLSTKDLTLPDAREGRPLLAMGAVRVINASARPVEKAVIKAGDGKLCDTVTAVPFIPPFGVHKAPFLIRLAPLSEEHVKENKFELPVEVVAPQGRSRITVRLRYRRGTEAYKETFLSDIDNSTQYFGVRPPSKPLGGPGHLYLSLHGASVEAHGQANAYTPKPDGWVVAATNRRPFGFDWEDWGRLDALEVLAEAKKRFLVDPNRVYLTGHSMGGHGTWHVGVNHPGLFAGIGPSAGWISFFSYGGARKMKGKGPEEIIARCMGPSDTLSLKENLADLPVFIIHGAIDDNVPVRESRKMVEELKPFHKDFVYLEVPGKKHWWNDPETPGTDCVDLSDLFDFFARNVRPKAPRRLAFRTWNPGVSADHRWIRVEGQETLLGLSTVEALAVPGHAALTLKTKNVSRLSFDPTPHFVAGEIKVRSGEKELAVKWPGRGRVHILKTEAGWKAASPPGPECKRPGRYGPFKAVFNRRFALVYGTAGTPEENRLALARARFDASMWWYRANGAAEVLPDSRFDPETFKGRNVILYGHADQNRAFETLLSDSPVRLKRGSLAVGDRVWKGDDVALLLIRPSPLGDDNLVGVVGGTGAKGLLATLRVSYIRSFVQFPDWTAFRFTVAEKGMDGLLGVGLFGPEWNLEKGEAWFQKEADEGF